VLHSGHISHEESPDGNGARSELLAQSLKSQGVKTMFYVMGGPMLETEATCIKLGIRAIDTRHEQAAALAAHGFTSPRGRTAGEGSRGGDADHGRRRHDPRA